MQIVVLVVNGVGGWMAIAAVTSVTSRPDRVDIVIVGGVTVSSTGIVGRVEAVTQWKRS